MGAYDASGNSTMNFTRGAYQDPTAGFTGALNSISALMKNKQDQDNLRKKQQIAKSNRLEDVAYKLDRDKVADQHYKDTNDAMLKAAEDARRHQKVVEDQDYMTLSNAKFRNEANASYKSGMLALDLAKFKQGKEIAAQKAKLKYKKEDDMVPGSKGYYEGWSKIYEGISKKGYNNNLVGSGDAHTITNILQGIQAIGLNPGPAKAIVNSVIDEEAEYASGNNSKKLTSMLVNAYVNQSRQHGIDVSPKVVSSAMTKYLNSVNGTLPPPKRADSTSSVSLGSVKNLAAKVEDKLPKPFGYYTLRNIMLPQTTPPFTYERN